MPDTIPRIRTVSVHLANENHIALSSATIDTCLVVIFASQINGVNRRLGPISTSSNVLIDRQVFPACPIRSAPVSMNPDQVNT